MKRDDEIRAWYVYEETCFSDAEAGKSVLEVKWDIIIFGEKKKSALIIWTNNRHCLSDTNLTFRFQRDNCHVMYEYNAKYRVIR